MYSLSVENGKGERLELTNNINYDVVHISGLTPPAANINRTIIAGADGSSFNSAIVGERNIVVTLCINEPIEDNRQALYRYFQNKKPCRLYFQNKNRDVYIDGRVETFENDLFGNLQQPQISIICCKPYFKKSAETVVSFTSVTDNFEFAFAIEAEGIEFGTITNVASKVVNAGDIETGGIIEFTARTAHILNPVVYNLTTNKSMTINFDMQQGDVITINTQHGEKSILLTRGGAVTNILNDLASGSEWITFESGDNEISYSAAEGIVNLDMAVTLNAMYGGV